MDPNATLAEIRRAVAYFNGEGEQEPNPAEMLDILVEHVNALDEWLSKGGFFPDAWSWNATERQGTNG